MVYGKDKNGDKKTYLDRFIEHKTGKGGVYLYDAISKFGETDFYIELVEEGPFEYIKRREAEESKNTLFSNNAGWNGNTGNAIYNSPEKIVEITKKRMLVEDQRVLKFKKSFGKLDKTRILNKRRDTISKKTDEEIYNWRSKIVKSIKGETKYSNERIERQSKTLKEKWKNPTDKMLIGNKKSADWKRGKTKENWKVMETHSKYMELKVKGKNNPMFKHYYITPLGKFETFEQASIFFNAPKMSGIRKLCKCPDKVITKTIAKFSNLPSSFIGMTAKEAGFGLEWV
jgi:hypothetical protein